MTPDACTPKAPDVEILPVPTPTVAQLLSQSRAHAQRRTELSNQRTNGKHTPQYKLAEAEAQKALDTRLQAHQLDPTHTDPSWALDKAPHDKVVAFLKDWIALP